MRMTLLAASLVLATPALTLSAAAAEDPIVVSHAWARATTSSAMSGGAFLTVTAHGHPDVLVGASSPVAKRVEVHETVNDKGVMKMKAVPRLALPSGLPVTMKPGGYHIMLMGLNHGLVRGEHFPLTLQFQHAKPVTVDVTIEGPGASGPMGAGMKHKP